VVNFNGAASPEPARVIRQALPGQAGEAISSKERSRQL
jgi:hypothetical protein